MMSVEMPRERYRDETEYGNITDADTPDVIDVITLNDE